MIHFRSFLCYIFRILQHFGTTSEEFSVIFTAGCTAALKLVAETFDYHGNQNRACGSDSVCCHSNGFYDSADATDEYFGDGQNQKGQQSKNSTCICSKRGSFNYLLDNHTSVQGIREIAFEKAGTVHCLDCDTKDDIHVASVLHRHKDSCAGGNHLFAYPAQSNFSGRKYPLDWVTMVKEGQMEWQKTISGSRSAKCQGHYYTVLDVASLVSTSSLDVGSVKPDFVALSFYKMFGYPTGLGRYPNT